jgi:hypothetical protein
LVPVPAVRESLRQAFQRWGLPQQLRVDNGHPWGSKGDLPTDLALWLIGLGVDVRWNTPCRPEENGVVERSQGTGKRWGEPHTCVTAAELQARLDDLDRLQRERYPYRENQSRVVWYEGLSRIERPYRPDQEGRLWDWERVAEHLGNLCVERQVDQKGQISVYNRNLYVGVFHRQARVWLMFDRSACRWVIATQEGQVVKEVAAEELHGKRIQALEVTNRRVRIAARSQAAAAQNQSSRFHAKLPVA